MQSRPRLLTLTSALLIFISPAVSIAQSSEQAMWPQEVDGRINPVPLDDENIPDMFIGPLDPEQAYEHAKRLAEARQSDPNAEVPIPEPITPRPKREMPPLYSEMSTDGMTTHYTIREDGSKVYLPPTSALFYLLHPPERRQVSDKEAAEFSQNALNNVSLSLVIAPYLSNTLIESAGIALQTILFPNTTSPFTVPTPYVCATDTCISPPTYGNGTTAQRGDLSVFQHAGYDYGASIIKEGNKYKMWWCSNGARGADNIYYAETTASTPTSGWTIPVGGNPIPKLVPSTSSSEFDGGLICDPSVIKIGGKYFMYYGGNTVNGNTCASSYSQTTRIGVASSDDGLDWTKHGVIVEPRNECSGTYGAGQPSAVFVDGYVYLTFNDTTAPLTTSQYAIRSADPTFQSGVQELTAGNTWSPTSNGKATSSGANNLAHSYSWLTGTVNVDWAYSQATQEFVVAINGVGDYFTSLSETALPRGSASSVRVFNKALSTQTRSLTHATAQWVEGPGLIHYGSGGILTDTSCSNIQVRVINPGRDWWDYDDPSGSNPDMNLNGCESAYHRFMAGSGSNADFQKFFNCSEFSHEGWDFASGKASCRAWTNSLGRVRADDYDGDGISDPTVWRPSTGVWWTRTSSNGAQVGMQWGLSTDQPIFGADFDGDRVADPAVKRGADFFIKPSTGTCRAPMSPFTGTLGCIYPSPWGSTDVPLPGDFDGDGITDIASRSTSGNIRYIPSTGSGCASGFTGTTYGTVNACFSLAGASGDKPLVADYDGDGLTDRVFQTPSLSRISVYPSTGVSSPICASLNMAFVSPSGPCYTNMGATTDVPITGYFDSDNKTDIMWWTAASGWNFKTWGQSSNNGAPVNFSGPAPFFLQFGLTNDIPLAKDFNSDSLSEPTVYRNSSGYWYVNRTSASAPPATTWALVPGTTTVYSTQWGLSTDKVEGLR